MLPSPAFTTDMDVMQADRRSRDVETHASTVFSHCQCHDPDNENTVPDMQTCRVVISWGALDYLLRGFSRMALLHDRTRQASALGSETSLERRCSRSVTQA